MNFTIRPAEDRDFPQILGLIKELATFEKAPEQVTNTVEQMQHEKDYFKCLVAENEQSEIIGMAVYFFAYFTWVGKSLYLDDIYVKASLRGNGVGSQLMRKVFDIAVKEDCKRVRWQVLDWNEPAINLYKKMGAKLDAEWYNCDFDQKAIQEVKI